MTTEHDEALEQLNAMTKAQSDYSDLLVETQRQMVAHWRARAAFWSALALTIPLLAIVAAIVVLVVVL